MGNVMIPVLLLAIVLVGGFIVWEVYFTRRGQRAMMEQHDAEGRDDPPKLI
jgi:hypothetical protein